MSQPVPPKGCLGALLGLFGIKIDLSKLVVSEKLEADLYPLDAKGLKFAELEFSRFQSGDTVFDIEIESRSGIPAGEEAVVLILGVEVCRLIMGHGSDTETKLLTHVGDEVPPIKAGDNAQLMYLGTVIAEGVFETIYRAPDSATRTGDDR